MHGMALYFVHFWFIDLMLKIHRFFKDTTIYFRFILFTSSLKVMFVSKRIECRSSHSRDVMEVLDSQTALLKFVIIKTRKIVVL